jgi:hypothetical protein
MWTTLRKNVQRTVTPGRGDIGTDMVVELTARPGEHLVVPLVRQDLALTLR